MVRNNNNPAGVVAWSAVNLAMLILALLAWGWLDYRYIHEYWTPEEMRQATEWLLPAIASLAMLVNLWLLRRHGTALHLVGALGSATAITALWWAIILLAGDSFHTALGGTPAS